MSSRQCLQTLSLVQAPDTMLHFPQAENSGCIRASPLPTKPRCGARHSPWHMPASTADRCHSLRSLSPPLAALPSLPIRLCGDPLKGNRSVPAPPGIATRRNAESVGADDLLRCPANSLAFACVVCRPLPLARVASSATGSASLAPHIGPHDTVLFSGRCGHRPLRPLFSVILSERSESKDPRSLATLQGILRLRLRLRSE